MPVQFRRELLRSEILHPARDFQPVPSEVEVRWDPLTGHSSRIVRGVKLLPASSVDLEALARQTQDRCFFCPGRIEQATPRLPAAIHLGGRIRRGQAVLFPNIVGYSQYSSVAVYGPDLHFLPLERMTPRLVADNLHTQVEFVSAVMGADPEAQWASINANHMLPSGSSLFHPHTQGSVDRYPTTFQRLLSQVGRDQFRAYLDTEPAIGERYIAEFGGIEWLASFAPIGFHELRAFLPGASSPAELGAEQVEALGDGLATALNLYAELGFQSFNAALYGSPPAGGDAMLNLRLVARSNLEPLYRSDATYYERLHWQAMVDSTPEELAARARERFRRAHDP
jgi:UDPglucose--hexose-1-phosphate uridylyltransferase